MSGYLQRLFDRAAGAAVPQPAPAGASQSPIAAADQRLNDPVLAGLFGLMSPAEPEGSIAEAGDAPGRTSPSPRRDSAVAPPIVEPADPSPLRSTPAVAPESVAAAPAAPPPTAVAAPPHALGRVAADDLVLPAPPVATPLEPPVSPPPPASVAEPPTPTPKAAQPADNRLATAAPVPARPAESPPPPPFAATSAMPPAPAPVAATSPEIPSPDPQMVTSTTPPAMAQLLRPPPLPPPPATAEAPPPQPAPAAAPTPPRSAPEPQRAESRERRDTPPAPRRPMTAAQASQIGPLSAEPRTITLFGLRRR